MKKIFIETHGCPSNKADSEIMAGILKQNGFDIVNSPEDAHLNILNTCNVKLVSSHRMIHRIKGLTKLGKPLIVAGCMTKTEKTIIKKINPEVSLLGPDSILKIMDVAKAALEGKKIETLKDLRKPKLCLPRVRRNPVVAIIPIAIGCLSNCSYCCVKFARGRLFSYPVEMIVKEARQAINDGCKELWICSQDNGCYGKDIGTNLPGLLKEICKIDGKFFIRVGMMNPLYVRQILDDLVQAYKNEKIFKFLHLPVQSFSSRILRLMKRGYTPNTVLEIINKFYKALPDLTFSTDIITGFPTENNSDAKKTIKFLHQVKPDIVNISKFGPRPRTMTTKLKQLSPGVIKRRSKELFKLIKSISLEKNRKWFNWSGECLIDEKGTKKNTWIGRNFVYKPIVVHSSESLLGKFINIKVIDIKSNYLIGKPI